MCICDFTRIERNIFAYPHIGIEYELTRFSFLSVDLFFDACEFTACV